MHRVPVSLVLLIATAAASTANMPTSTAGKGAGAATQDIENISSPLEIVNPWLSACDLAQPATAPDLQGTCSTATPVPANLWIRGPGPPERDKPPPAREQHAQHHEHSSSHPPLPCSPSSAHRNASTTSNQCLYYLEESHKKMVCDLGKARAWRHERIAELRLRHCSEHDLLSSLSNQLLENVLNGGEQCRYAITAILDTDALAARITCEFTEVLIRYDCGQPYSIVFNCDDCKNVYRRWVCSSLIPYFTNRISTEDSNRTNSSTSNNSSSTRTLTESSRIISSQGNTNSGNGSASFRRRVKPCRSVCQTVEQRCPYMLPGDRAPAYPTQYAGEPTFICLDPNIPETGEQALKSSYGDEDCCYSYCEENICAKCLSTAKPDVTTILEESSWRVRCTASPAGGSTSLDSSSGDTRASNCPSKIVQSSTVVVVITAQQDYPSSSGTYMNDAHKLSSATVTSSAVNTLSHAHKTIIQITIFAAAWTAVWTNKLVLVIILTVTILINRIEMQTTLLLIIIMIVHSVYELLKKEVMKKPQTVVTNIKNCCSCSYYELKHFKNNNNNNSICGKVISEQRACSCTINNTSELLALLEDDAPVNNDLYYRITNTCS